MLDRSELYLRIELPDAQRTGAGSRPTLKPAHACRWRSISLRARRRKQWAIGLLSAVIAAELVALLIAGGVGATDPRSSRLGPLDATADEAGGFVLLGPGGEPLPILARRVSELPSSVLASVPDLIEHYERIPWGLPVSLERGWVSSEFGMRLHPISGERRFHAGIDLAVDTGTPVSASARGVVTFTGRRGGYGLLVIVDHENGMSTRYAHLSKLLVKVGDHVERGERIALSGATGNVTGEHLHYEVRINDEPVNPRPYLPEGLPDKRPPGM